MRDRVEAALHRYLRNLHVTDGQQLARIADAHIRYILQESLFRDLFEEAAKGAAVHIRHFGNLVELEGTGVIAVDEFYQSVCCLPWGTSRSRKGLPTSSLGRTRTIPAINPAIPLSARSLSVREKRIPCHVPGCRRRCEKLLPVWPLSAAAVSDETADNGRKSIA